MPMSSGYHMYASKKREETPISVNKPAENET
jgi:hypothetical protein